MQKLTYHEAIKAVGEGKLVILLPEGANPYYLSFGVQKYHPLAAAVPTCSIHVSSTATWGEWREEKSTHKEIVSDYAACKAYVLNTFSNEEGVSHTKVTAWLV